MKAIERVFLSNDLITITFLLGLILLFLMKLYKPQRLLGYAIAFFTQGFIEKRSEKKPPAFSSFHIMILLFSTITFTLLFFLHPAITVERNFTSFLLIFCLVLGYFLLHYFVNYSVSSLLNIKSEVQYFLFSKFGYLYTLSLLLFPILIAYNYGFNNIYFLSISFISLLIFRSFLILKNNKNLIFNKLFYFILYFCTLELAPLLILYKTTTV